MQKMHGYINFQSGDTLMSRKISTKFLIIGGGPAGYTAAIYAARANLNPILVQGMQPGGQLMITTDVENYPGFAEAIQGPWLMEQMQAQAKNVGTEMISDIVTEVNLSSKPYKAICASGLVIEANTICIATGATARWLGLESEDEYKGYGVSACATCDAFFYRGKKVAVVGGGNTALEEALFLTNHASEVVLIHRRDAFRGEKIMQDRVFNHPKIKIEWHAVIEEVLGEKGTPQNPNAKSVTGVRLKNTENGSMKEMNVDGVFVAIGHDPATSVFKGKIDMDAEGYIITKPDSTQTNIPGVYAAGDVKDKIYRQAVTAAGLGCMAALEAEKYLAEQNALSVAAA